MISNVKKLIENDFIRNVFILVTGTAGAQAISMLFTPIITRIYGPEVIGVFGIFVAIIGVLAPVAALAFPIAIVLPKLDSEAKDIGWLSFYISILTSGFVALVLYFFGNEILRGLGYESMSPYVFIFPVAMFFAAQLQILQQWSIRKQLYKLLAKVAFIQSLVINLTKVGLGYINPIALFLIITSVLTSLLQSLMLLFVVRERKSNRFSLTNLKVCCALIRKYYDFAVYRSPQLFLNGISQSLPILMLASYFGAAVAGYFTIAKMILGIPAQLIGKSVSDVFYPKITKASQNGEPLTSTILKATGALALTGIIPFIVIAIFGPELFKFAFGDEWGVAGDFSRWLAFWMFFVYINSPSITALPVLAAQRFHLIFSILTMIVRFLTIYYSYVLFNDEFISVMYFSIVSGLMNAILITSVLVISVKKSKAINC